MPPPCTQSPAVPVSHGDSPLKLQSAWAIRWRSRCSVSSGKSDVSHRAHTGGVGVNGGMRTCRLISALRSVGRTEIFSSSWIEGRIQVVPTTFCIFLNKIVMIPLPCSPSISNVSSRYSLDRSEIFRLSYLSVHSLSLLLLS